MNRPGWSAVLLAVVTYVAVLAMAWVPAILWPDWFAFAWVDNPVRDLVAGTMVGGAIVAVSWAFSTRTESGRQLSRQLAAIVEGLPSAGLPLMALAAGVAEEALFRGALWLPIARLAGPAVALVATSLLFGAAHGLFRSRFRAWSLFALVTGVALGALRLWTGALLASIVAHLIVDAINLPLVKRIGRPSA